MKLICRDAQQVQYEFTLDPDLDFQLLAEMSESKDKIGLAFKEAKNRLRGNIPNGFHPKEII